MATINALFILVLCLIGFGVYSIFAIPLWLVTGDRLLYRRNSPNRLLVGLIALPTLYVMLLFAGYTWATRPAAIFEMAFNFKPPAEVEFHASYHYVLGDYGEQSLKFSVAPSTIDRILNEQFETSLGDSLPTHDGILSFTREFSDSFVVETAKLQYNQNTLRARYHWVAID